MLIPDLSTERSGLELLEIRGVPSNLYSQRAQDRHLFVFVHAHILAVFRISIRILLARVARTEKVSKQARRNVTGRGEARRCDGRASCCRDVSGSE